MGLGKRGRRGLWGKVCGADSTLAHGLPPVDPSSSHQGPGPPMPVLAQSPPRLPMPCRVTAQPLGLALRCPPSLTSAVHSHLTCQVLEQLSQSPFPSLHFHPPFAVPTASGAHLPALAHLPSSSYLLSPALATYSFPCRNTATRAVQPPTWPEASSSRPITSSWGKASHFSCCLYCSPYHSVPSPHPTVYFPTNKPGSPNPKSSYDSGIPVVGGSRRIPWEGEKCCSELRKGKQPCTKDQQDAHGMLHVKAPSTHQVLDKWEGLR